MVRDLTTCQLHEYIYSFFINQSQHFYGWHISTKWLSNPMLSVANLLIVGFRQGAKNLESANFYLKSTPIDQRFTFLHSLKCNMMPGGWQNL